MGKSPFATKDLFPSARSRPRRSTRIDFVTPIILVGRDASGQPFREETATSIVNLHGAKIATTHHIMVGMIVSLENPRTGQGGKAVCVQVLDTPPGQSRHDVAVQLVQPGNMWGVENPPPDWGTVEAELGGSLPVAESRSKPAATFMKPMTAASVTSALATGRMEADAQSAELEKRAARLIDSVLEILRIQADAAVRNSVQELEKRVEGLMAAVEPRFRERAEQASEELELTLDTFRTEAMGEVVREALQGFQQALEALTAEADARITRRAEESMAALEAALRTFQQRQETATAEAAGDITRRAEQALADFDAALQTFRADVGDELAARREEVVQSTEEALRTRMAVVLSKNQMPAPAPPDATRLGPALKK